MIADLESEFELKLAARWTAGLRDSSRLRLDRVHRLHHGIKWYTKTTEAASFLFLVKSPKKLLQ